VEIVTERTVLPVHRLPNVHGVTLIAGKKNEVIELVIESRTRAIGAAFSNGLGLELTGIRSDAIKSVKGHILGGGTIHKLGSNQLEEGQEFATVILFDNAFSVLQRVTGGTGINVDPSSPMSEVKTQTVTVSFEPGKVKNSELTMGMLNPFMIINQDRGREVHLAGKQPTRLANSSLFGTGEDITKVGSLQTYLSKEDNLPWAIWINESIPYMQEKVEITKGFVMLRYWANSNGEKMQDWYMDIPGHINRELVIGNK
jgi:LruC domain-containing protein